MPRPKKPFVVQKRKDWKTYIITLNISSGLPARVCDDWQRKSFQNFPAELIMHSQPKTMAAATAGAVALIAYLRKKQEEGGARRVVIEDITVGAWLEKFTAIETNPRTGINVSRNRPYSADSIENYEVYYRVHIKGDFLTGLKMGEVEEEDALAFITRMSVKKLKDGRPMGGTRTFAGVVKFVSMAFKSYQRQNRQWQNPFQYIDPPLYNKKTRDFLPEEEMIRLFCPGVLQSTMELAVCAVMFLSGLRRAEVAALKPEDLDWQTPKITVRRAWQNFESKNRVLGPPKSKKERIAPFDPLLQEAIKKLWEDNGKHEFVFCWKNGEHIGPSWAYNKFQEWLKKAGIELGGRDIVPHSSRHSLASILEDRGESLRHIQEMLGHSDLKTTKIYLHSTEKTIRNIGEKISESMNKQEAEQKVLSFNAS